MSNGDNGSEYEDASRRLLSSVYGPDAEPSSCMLVIIPHSYPREIHPVTTLASQRLERLVIFSQFTATYRTELWVQVI